MRLCALFAVCAVALAGCDSNPAQPTCAYTLSATSMTMSATGGTGTVSVATGSGCAWTASSSASWLTATGGASGSGPGTVTVAAAANSGPTSRTGSLTVAGQSVSVTQQGLVCSYVLQPGSRTLDAAGGTATFDVNTDAACSWTAVPMATWITIVSGGSGSGNATVTYRAAANPDATSRTAGITAGNVTHTVTQTGLTSCTFDISRSGDNFGVGGGNGSFEVGAPSNCAWLAVSSASWVRITDPAGGAGTGSRRVSFTVDANGGAGARTATVTIGARTYTVAQAGTTACEYSVAPVEVKACMSVGYITTITVSTAAGCPWASSTPASWIAITSGLSGSGPSSITFSMTANFDAARQGTIEVRWPTPTAGQNVRVSQAGCYYGISRDSIDVPAAGGDFTFDVISSSTDNSCGGPLQNGCVWSAVSSAPWVTVLSSMPRNGDNPVSFRVAANGTGAQRTATITVRDRTVTIRQAGS
jgi:hypothetical protein